MEREAGVCGRPRGWSACGGAGSPGGFRARASPRRLLEAGYGSPAVAGTAEHP